MLRLLDDFMQFCLQGKDYVRAEALCSRTIPIYLFYYGENDASPIPHPLLGLQYFMLAKLQWYNQHADQTVVTLQRAIPMLSISHGHLHTLVEEARRLADEANAELAATRSTR
jgi:hypothetical protein